MFESMQEMQILMIGNENSGKTTYMASSYGLMKKGRFGFYICADEDTDTWLTKLYNNVKDGGYPLSSDKRNSFEFNLYYYQQPLLSFEWLDYYGGVINESKSAQLMTDIDEADAVMLFIEADALLRNDKKVTQLRRILYLIGKKLMKVDHFFNVIVVLAKYDTVGTSASFEDVCRMLSQFSESVQKMKNVYYRIVPVSCTSSGFVNVDLPLIDILHSGVWIKCLDYMISAKAQYDRVVEYNGKRGVVNWVFSKLLGLQTNGEIADKAAKNMQQQLALFEQIKDPFDKLDQYRKDYEIKIPQNMITWQFGEKRTKRSRFGIL